VRKCNEVHSFLFTPVVVVPGIVCDSLPLSSLIQVDKHSIHSSPSYVSVVVLPRTHQRMNKSSSPTVIHPTSRGAPARSPRRSAHFFMPRTSAGERSSWSDSWPDASTFVGPPLAYTPVYVLCTRAPALSACAR